MCSRHPSVHIVSAEWLEECLRKWRFVPEGIKFELKYIIKNSITSTSVSGWYLLHGLSIGRYHPSSCLGIGPYFLCISF